MLLIALDLSGILSTPFHSVNRMAAKPKFDPRKMMELAIKVMK